jgi:diguanylate cyclase (GGDEF)-like protein
LADLLNRQSCRFAYMRFRKRPDAAPAALTDGVAGILHEARVAGLRSLQAPSIADIERRRTEVWVLMGLLIGVCAAAVVVLSFWSSAVPWLSTGALKGTVIALLVTAAAYSVEKERQLRRLTRLLLDERVLTTALTDRLHEIETLLEAGAAVNSAHELDTVLDIILTSAIELLGGSGGAVLRREEDSLVTVTSLGDGQRVGTRVEIGEGPAGRAARMRDALLITGTRGRKSAAGSGSTMAVPMIESGEVVGVLLVHAPPQRCLSEYDMRAASLLAASAAAAMTKADLLSAARSQAAELEHAAYHDPLTSLANRALFSRRVDEALHRTRNGGALTAILFIDLDGFKNVNDRLGHTAGDTLLAAFAERLRRCLRHGAQAARLGGDEFAVLLSDVDDAAVATVVARRILASVNRPYSLDGREAQPTASIGISYASPDDSDATWETLIGQADLAMYDAKRRARGSYRVFDPSLHTDEQERSELEARLDVALNTNELVLRYQPIVSLEDGKIAGAEALVRWAHPERGLLSPDSFVPIAVESGAIVAMGRIVLREACRQLADWQGAHGAAAPPWVSVNVSARQIDAGTLIDDVHDALEAAGLPGEALVLELTEDALVSEDDNVTRTLAEIRRTGVRVAIDDFGSRYSALSYLLRLPVDVLKVDKSFIDGLGLSTESAAVVRTIVDLSHRLGLETIAEGVETEGQGLLLADLGCRLAQGYRFARPLTPNEIDALLSRGSRPLANLIPGPRAGDHHQPAAENASA